MSEVPLAVGVCLYMSEVPLGIGVCVHEGGITVCWCVCVHDIYSDRTRRTCGPTWFLRLLPIEGDILLLLLPRG